MKAILNWTSNMSFEAECDNNHVVMDSKAPLGKNSGMTPKELVATGLGGCTAMDVVALLKKHKQNFSEFKIQVDTEQNEKGHPKVFTKAHLIFSVSGEVDAKILIDSVELSQTKYCGVSAMLAKALPITYDVVLNNEKIASGSAKFDSVS